MGVLSNKGTFIAAIVAIVGLSIGSLAYSQTVSFGAETDVGTETDVPPPATGSSGPDVFAGVIPGGNFPAPGGSTAAPGGAPGLPPAAPIDSGSNDSGAASASSGGGVGSGVNALPSTGSGGYLESNNSSLPFALLALAAMVAMTGSLLLAKSRS